MRKILVIGATSAIAEATARLFAADGDRLYLVARNAGKLEAVAHDLQIRGAVHIETQIMDATDYDRHEAMIEKATNALGGLDTVLIAHGTLPDQRACEESFELTRREFETNALSVISLLTRLANQFEKQGHGTIAVISSAAGDRGRQSNYVYGTAKSAVSTFLQGLRNRLHRSGIRVLTIKPGFVDTPMTASIEKNFLWSRPETVAMQIYRATKGKRDILYSPWFWLPIMAIIKRIPEFVFKRLSL